MSNSNWIRSQNFIDNVCDGNFKLAFDIFDAHDSMLHGSVADTDILALYNNTHTAITNYKTTYSDYLNMRGQGQGGTLNLQLLIEDLAKNKARQWDIAIQGVYDQKSPEYKALLPNRRNPFQSGTIESRIASVGTLITAMGSITALATLKTGIETFYTSLTTARDAQHGNMAALNVALANLESQRLAAAQLIFKNYANLLIKYYQTPEQVTNFFPVNMFTRRDQTNFTGTVGASASKLIFKRKLDPADDHLFLLNDGDVPLNFYFTDGLTEQAGQTLIAVAPHSQLSVTPAQLGYTDTQRYLYASNTAVSDAHFEVDID